MDFFDALKAVIVLGLLIGMPLAASRSDRLSRALLVALPVAGIVLILDLIVISTDFHDADGIFDCWPACSTWQNLVSWTLSVGTLLFLVFVITVIVRQTLRSRSRPH
jgi:hypothetical protein